MITASQLALLLRCPGQAVIPHYDSTSEDAERGAADHAELLPALVSGNLPRTPQGRRLRSVEIPDGARAEAAVAVDVERYQARPIDTRHPRDYASAVAGEIPGTADILASRFALELKAGSFPVPPARRNVQVLFFALAELFMSGDLSTVVLAQVDAGGHGAITEHLPSRSQLLALRDRLMRLLGHIEDQRRQHERGSRLSLVRGPHCVTCSAVAVCPAVSECLGGGTPADRWLAARALLARASEAEGFAMSLLVHDEEPVTDGPSLHRRVRGRRRLDAGIALKAIPELHAVARYRLSIGDVHAWAGSGVQRGLKGAARDQVMGRLVDAGALQRTESIEYEEAHEAEQ